jgi:EAL domain-containing protein (putative c-di-GMP-specific phosphodiesterase class I)/GGDEF domain-containing protein
MFRRLSTELAVVYAGLFGAVLLLIAGAVFIAVSDNSDRTVRAEMTASSAVFDRLWNMRADQLSSTAEVLSRDFGFRKAAATGDKDTILSALDNLQSRFSLDTAMLVDLDGRVLSLDDKLDGQAPPDLKIALDAREKASGVIMLGGQPYQAVAAQVSAPTPIGWVVFGQRIGAKELGELEGLSAVPLKARLYLRSGDGAWAGFGEKAGGKVDAKLGAAFDHPGKTFVRLPDRDAIAGAKTIQSFGPGLSASLLLEYSMTTAQAHDRSLMGAIMIIGGVGLIALIAGSWLVSGRVTGPISALRAAAGKLARGELAEVTVHGRNEIAELAANFNRMSGEIAAREQRITQMARHDNETGLLNLRALEDRLDERRWNTDRARIYAAAIAIDRFAHLRGAIGHGLSAKLIAEIGERVAQLSRGMIVGRTATDTVGVVFEADALSDAQALVAEIASNVQRPLHLGADSIAVQATIGLACDADGVDMAVGLLGRAEVAVAQARAKRISIAMFDRAAYGDPASSLSLMSSMIAGLERGDLYLAHQPKFDFRAGRAVSAESLLRWKHPDRGFIPPDSFIGMAEETGHIRPLTDWVLDRAIYDQRIMREAGIEIPLSINISGRLLSSEEFAERAIRQIRRSSADLCFEITETAVIDNPKIAIAIMQEWRDAGVGVSIDDYGSGLSSLSYLRTIPAQELKIDRSFVMGMSSGNSDSLLVKSTVDLAHSLGMSVTAEGVETAEQFAILSAMGADTAQGYYIARPLAMKDALEFWTRGNAASRSA